MGDNWNDLEDFTKVEKIQFRKLISYASIAKDGVIRFSKAFTDELPEDFRYLKLHYSKSNNAIVAEFLHKKTGDFVYSLSGSGDREANNSAAIRMFLYQFNIDFLNMSERRFSTKKIYIKNKKNTYAVYLSKPLDKDEPVYPHGAV